MWTHCALETSGPTADANVHHPTKKPLIPESNLSTLNPKVAGFLIGKRRNPCSRSKNQEIYTKRYQSKFISRPDPVSNPNKSNHHAGLVRSRSYSTVVNHVARPTVLTPCHVNYAGQLLTLPQNLGHPAAREPPNMHSSQTCTSLSTASSVSQVVGK